MVDKKIIAKNFSRCAHLYDKYAAVQHFAAAELLKGLPRRDFANILEIGCGTGIYTEMLRKRFGMSRIEAIDISSEMIEVATAKMRESTISFLVGDAERVCPKWDYDLITSSAAFQWFDDLEAATARFKNALKRRGGVMTLSAFGPKTFQELGAVISELSEGRVSIGSAGFPGRRKLQDIMLRHFKHAGIKELMIKRTYPAFRDLLATIRYTGVRGNGSGAFMWKRRELASAELLYKKMFGAIEATYQIILCRASI